MKSIQNVRIAWVIPLLACAALAVAPATAQPERAVAQMAIHGNSMSFAPAGSFDGMKLTVAGMGVVVNKRVGAGQSVGFAPVDDQGYQLPDGTYKWEIVALPRPVSLDSRSLRGGETTENGRSVSALEASAGARQSGAFTIKNGAIVDPTLVEGPTAVLEIPAGPEIDDSDGAAN